jgi:hypothetical protein
VLIRVKMELEKAIGIPRLGIFMLGIAPNKAIGIF